MRTTFRRLLLLWFALRYGVRLLWSAAPREHRLHWVATLALRLHASPDAREALHRALPLLGPLASAFAAQSAQDPQALARSLHEAFDLIARTETALAAPLPADAVLPVLRAALPRSPELAFAAIDLVALDSGIGEQVHAARLARPERTTREGRDYVDVVVKLLRVQEIERIDDDIAVLGWVARWLDRFLPAARALRLYPLTQVLAAEVQRRFDLRAEAANLSQTGQHLRNDERVVVPDVVWELSSDHALVIEHIETLALNDLDALRRRGIDLEALAEHVVEV
ncbi:MAG: ABC transporter, partial [Burkholderiales bacterium]|nr:ABC transporter [Burkholderiales bacterium]